MDARLWKPDDVARYLGVSEQEVLTLVEEGVLPGYWIGGTFLRFRPEQVMAVRRPGVRTGAAGGSEGSPGDPHPPEGVVLDLAGVGGPAPDPPAGGAPWAESRDVPRQTATATVDLPPPAPELLVAEPAASFTPLAAAGRPTFRERLTDFLSFNDLYLIGAVALSILVLAMLR